MINRCICVFVLWYAQISFAQKNLLTYSDTIVPKRLTVSSIAVGTAWSGSMIGLYQIWYKNENQSSFHTFNDGRNWLQMDKVGHVYTTYQISKLSKELFHWSGLKERKAALLGTGIGLGFQTTLEIFDGFSQGWGFSWWDITGNLVGGGLYLGQDALWNRQIILPKFSFHPTEYASLRPSVLGGNFAEELLKDYNGQTYWLSFSPGQMKKNSVIPSWLCLSVGYSADAKLVGDQETFTSMYGKTYHSSRQWLFSLDIDFSSLPVKRKWVRMIYKQLNYLKIPFPALILSNGKLTAHPIYF